MNPNTSNQVPVAAIPSNPRIEKLQNVFNSEFNSKPSFIVRVPGRVNIIGEHIDYCGYPVLPMAVEQDILIAVGLVTERKLYIRNTNEKYPSFEMDIKTFEDIKIKPDNNGKPYWYNYVLCGVKGAIKYLENNISTGLQLTVDGNVPPASGLSSSSALVSAACLSFLFAHDVNLPKTEIASLCAKSEKYIGTESGGMDHAIAFLGEKYCAQYITFQPLTATPVALPKDATFVIAHSLAEANKAATNDYNQRVIECRLSAKILATHKGENKDNNIITLSQVQKLLGCSLDEMIKLVLKCLPKDFYTKNEICGMLGISEEEMDKFYLTPNTRDMNQFKLKQRALHVYEEAKRVETFREMCTNAGQQFTNGANGNKNGDIGDSGIIDVLGKLISASHESLKNLYECSHTNLDRIVEISKEMNVYARLTGAGWGGCAVALCPSHKVNEYIAKLKEEFYEKFCKVDKVKASQFVFATKPNLGAIIYKNV